METPESMGVRILSLMRGRAQGSVVVVVLLIAGWKSTCGLEDFADIIWSDDNSIYMMVAAHFLEGGELPPADWGPLYVLWYSLLMQIQADRVQVYFLNLKILTVLLPVVIFIVLRRYKLPLIHSMMIAAFLLVSNANLLLLPKVTHLTALFVVLTFLIASYVRSSTDRMLVLSAGGLLCSYLHPDLFVTYLFCFLLYVGIVLYHVREFRYSHVIVIWSLSSCFLLFTFGFPMFTGEATSRSFEAFGQHFSGRYWASRTGSNSASDWTYYREILRHCFDGAKSIPEAVINNPPLFLGHLAYNVSSIPPVLRWFPVINCSKTFLPAGRVYEVLEKSVLVALAALYLFRTRKTWIHGISERIRVHKELLVSFGLYSLPGIISVLVIFPRAHYLLIPFILLLVYLSVLILQRPDRGIYTTLAHLSIAALLVFVVTPTGGTVYSQGGRPGKHQDRLNVVRAIQSLSLSEPANILSAEADYHLYLNSRSYRSVKAYSKRTDFRNFMNAQRINVIVLSDDLLQDRRYKEDTDWQFFLRDYQQLGYRKIQILDSDRELLVKESLLKASSGLNGVLSLDGMMGQS